MAMNVERKRPIKMFVVKVAHGPYRVGDKIQPTGMYRQVLLMRGLIEEVKEELVEREAVPALDRMVPSASGGNGALVTRRKRR